MCRCDTQLVNTVLVVPVTMASSNTITDLFFMIIGFKYTIPSQEILFEASVKSG